MDGFDCFTFDEAMIAMARTVAGDNYSYDDYTHYTRELHYRGASALPFLCLPLLRVQRASRRRRNQARIC